MTLRPFGRIIISIHTTTQVVTTRYSFVFYVVTYFNPHHHAGGDSNSTQPIIPTPINLHKNFLHQPRIVSPTTRTIQNNALYSQFSRCEPPRIFMYASHSHQGLLENSFPPSAIWAPRFAVYFPQRGTPC